MAYKNSFNANQKVRDNLGYLGPDFQERLVKCFFEDQTYFKNMENIIDQNMFTNEHLRRIVGFMKDRYNYNETVTTYFDMEALIRTKISDAISVEQCLAILEKIKNSGMEGMDIVEEECENFFKQQNLIKALNKAQDIIKSGDFGRYNEIEDIIKKALETNVKQELGWQLLDHVEEDLSENYRQVIPTGLDKLDAAIGGGLARGELGVVIAASNVGKSTLMTSFGAYAATCAEEKNNYNGYKVMHFYFEDEDVSIRRKYYGYSLDIDAKTLHYPEIRPVALDRLKSEPKIKTMLNGNLRGMRLMAGETRASDIRNIIKKHIALGFKPDLVIIDYFESLKYEKHDPSDSEWSREGITMRKLESMAHEFNVALWVPVQGTKDTLGAEFVGLTQGGGSVKKIQVAHTIITMAASDSMKLENRVNLFIGKLRGTEITRNKFLNVKFNHGTCHVDMSDCGDSNDMPFQEKQSTVQLDIARDSLKQQSYMQNNGWQK